MMIIQTRLMSAKVPITSHVTLSGGILYPMNLFDGSGTDGFCCDLAQGEVQKTSHLGSI